MARDQLARSQMRFSGDPFDDSGGNLLIEQAIFLVGPERDLDFLFIRILSDFAEGRRKPGVWIMADLVDELQKEHAGAPDRDQAAWRRVQRGAAKADPCRKRLAGPPAKRG